MATQMIGKWRLRNNGPEVSTIGLGYMRMSSVYGPDDGKQEMIKLLRTAVDMGIVFFDTAKDYGSFVHEQLIGEALVSIHSQAVIATKFGFDIDPVTRSHSGK